jgi:hypothetical protein
MGLLDTIIGRKTPSAGRVVAHILDPITGYSNRELVVGKDIAADSVRRLGDRGEVFVVVAYDGGAPTATLCTRAQWLRARAKHDPVTPEAGAAAWPRREELEIG